MAFWRSKWQNRETLRGGGGARGGKGHCDKLEIVGIKLERKMEKKS